MVQKSMLWTAAAGSGDGAATYTEAETTRLFRRLVTGTDNEGVLADPDEEFGAAGSNELAVSGTTSPVQVEAGDAWCHGYYYWSTAQEDVAIATPAGSTRIDRIVLRVDFAADTVRITLLGGVEGAGTPPALTQNATYWDIPLAQASITTGGVITITNEREYLHFNTKISGTMFDSDVVDATTIENNAGTLRVKDDGISNAKIRNSGACSVIGRSANSSGDPADISAGTNDRVLARQTNALVFVQVSTDMIADDAVTPAKIPNRSRSFFVTPYYGYVTGVGPIYFEPGIKIGLEFPDAAVSSAVGRFLVPADFATTINVEAVFQSVTSGNIYCSLAEAYYGTPPEAYNNHTYTYPTTTKALTAGQMTKEFILPLASAVAGDVVTVKITRTATNVADTLNDVVYFLGWLVSYTADS